MSTEETKSLNFIEAIIEADLASGKHEGRVHTRFPPEPNGYLHVGHAKSICLNFGLAAKYGGKCNLRFDDTNPIKEEQEYIDSIQEDIRWLGFDWEDRLFFASDYFEQLYEWAVKLIQEGKAFVCDLTAEEMRQYRGTLTEPGKNSPHRDRPVEENLDLFERMKAGEFPDGSRTLRAKIDMASPNLNELVTAIGASLSVMMIFCTRVSGRPSFSVYTAPTTCMNGFSGGRCSALKTHETARVMHRRVMNNAIEAPPFTAACAGAEDKTFCVGGSVAGTGRHRREYVKL